MKLELNDCPILVYGNYDLPGGQSCIENKEAFEKSTNELLTEYNQLVDKTSEIENFLKKGNPNQQNDNNLENDDKKRLEGLKKRIEEISLLIKKEHIQIGFLGDAQVGKSSTLNAIFGIELAQTGVSGKTSSSAVVAYHKKKTNQDPYLINILDNDQLEKKYTYILDNLYTTTKAYIDQKNFSDFNETLNQFDFLNQHIKRMIDDIDIEETKNEISGNWDFCKAFKNNQIPKIKTVDIDEFKALVSHDYNDMRRHFVASARCPALPKFVPSVIEFVDVPGVAAEVVDDIVITPYLPKIDAWIRAYKFIVNFTGTEQEKIMINSCKIWDVESSLKTERFICIKTQVSKCERDYVKSYPQLKRDIDKYGLEKSFFTETKFYKESNFQDNDGFADLETIEKLCENYELEDLLKNSDPQLHIYSSKNDDGKNEIHLKKIKEFDLEFLMKEVLLTGGIPRLKNYIFKKWPEKIITEIIGLARRKITKTREGSEKFLKELENRIQLSPQQMIVLNKAVAKLSDVRKRVVENEINLLDGMQQHLNLLNIQFINPYNAQVFVNHLRNEAISEGIKILKNLVNRENGWIVETFSKVNDILDFPDPIRFDINKHDTVSLQDIFKKNVPLKNPSNNQIDDQNGFDVLEDDFKIQIINKTGLDELYQGFMKYNKNTKNKVDLLVDIANQMQNQNLQAFNIFKNMILESIKNVVIDLGTLIRNKVIQSLDNVIFDLQSLQNQGKYSL